MIQKKKADIVIPEINKVKVGEVNPEKKEERKEENSTAASSINGDATRPASQKPKPKEPTPAPPTEVSTSLYLYKPIFTMKPAYIKYVEPVYDGYERFSFNEVNYEISEKDIKYLEKSGLNITHGEFEKVIDTFEKIIEGDQKKDQSKVYLVSQFLERVPKQPNGKMYANINRQILEAIYDQVIQFSLNSF